MNGGEPSPIRQLLLGLKDGEGVAIVQHSMTSDNEALSWQRRLEEHARLLPWGAELALPEKALSYYRFDGQAVVLRRWATGGNLGRSDAHALVGPIDVLTVPVALGLDGLNWQSVARTAWRSLIGGELQTIAEIRIAELRDRAAHQPKILRRALGRLIDAQTKPLTILGCPDDHRVALTWALVYIGSEYLEKTSHKRRSWTFSTYEVNDADSIPNLPEILFMPGKPIGRGVASRDIVDVSCDQLVSPEAEEWSDLLVQRFVSRKPLVSEFDHPPAMPVTDAISISMRQPERQEQECSPEESVQDRRQNQTTTVPYAKEREREAKNSHPTRASAAQKASSQRLERELNKLFAATDKGSFKCQLDAMGKTPEEEERAEIRKLLPVDVYLELVSLIKKWKLSAKETLELFQSLRVATFGPDGSDLPIPDVAAFAVQLIKDPAAPDLFVHGLAKEMVAKGQSDRVNPAMGARCLEQHDPAKELADVSLSRWSVCRPRGKARTGRSDVAMSLLASRSWPLTAAGIALIASILFVALIYSITNAGTSRPGSNGEGTPTTQPTTSPSAGSQQQKEAVNSVDVSGAVAANSLVIRVPWQVAGNETPVFLLIRPVSETAYYYSQGACKANPTDQAWICEKLPPPVPETIKTPFEVLVVKINPQDERYQDFVNKKTLQSPLPALMNVIFKDSGRP